MSAYEFSFDKRFGLVSKSFGTVGVIGDIKSPMYGFLYTAPLQKNNIPRPEAVLVICIRMDKSHDYWYQQYGYLISYDDLLWEGQWPLKALNLYEMHKLRGLVTAYEY